MGMPQNDQTQAAQGTGTPSENDGLDHDSSHGFTVVHSQLKTGQREPAASSQSERLTAREAIEWIVNLARGL